MWLGYHCCCVVDNENKALLNYISTTEIPLQYLKLCTCVILQLIFRLKHAFLLISMWMFNKLDIIIDKFFVFFYKILSEDLYSGLYPLINSFVVVQDNSDKLHARPILQLLQVRTDCRFVTNALSLCSHPAFN